MNWLTTKIIRFIREEDGVTAIEYGLIAGLIAVGIITATTFLGDEIADIFTRIGNELSNVAVTP